MTADTMLQGKVEGEETKEVRSLFILGERKKYEKARKVEWARSEANGPYPLCHVRSQGLSFSE